MSPSAFLVLLPALVGLAASGSMPAAGFTPAPEARVLMAQNEVVMRIQLRPRQLHALEWVERKGPKCIATKSIRGAVQSGRREVDFLIKGQRRIRARLSDECPALDFYNGFYITPEDDDRICSRRDSIRSRIGGSCEIERFRELVPKLKD